MQMKKGQDNIKQKECINLRIPSAMDVSHTETVPKTSPADPSASGRTENPERKNTKEYARYNHPVFLYVLFFSLAYFFDECILKVYVYHHIFNLGLLFMLLFTISYSAIGTVLICTFKGRLRTICGLLFLLLTTFWLMLQTVYYRLFSTFFTLYSFSGAADVAEFWRSALSGIIDSAIPLLLMTLPLWGFIILRQSFRNESRPAIRTYALVLLCAIICQTGATALICHCGNSNDVMSEKYLYTKTFIPQLSVDNFGALTTLRLDLKNMIFGMDDTETAAAYEAAEALKQKNINTNYEDNILDIDFKKLAKNETNAAYTDMDLYFDTVTPSAKNEYTGLFAGKNLIWICAEGFSSWAMDKNLTPTLWKMAKECFVFENYYNPIWGVSTSDGEYALCTSLLPKSGTWSMSDSAKNDMPFAMGNQLSAAGYLTNAYHNHSYTYYNRNKSHPNLGYNFIAKGHGLNIKTRWPESDVEMMEQTVSTYDTKEPFHIYYMTVSGHLEYNFSGNAMAAKHKDEVADLPYSTPCKAYIACQIELNNAVEELITTLKEAGTLDDTLIVLSGDHYPYGLTQKQIEELNGGEVETNFELYHSTLIMWNSTLAKKDPVIIDKPCYSLDVLPTISNLMGVSYDSRLLMGRDIFSSASPLVVFANHSWLTDKGRYNASTGKFTPEENKSIREDYAKNMMDKVNSMFNYSAKILETDYYNRVVPKDFRKTADKSNKNTTP